MPILNNIHKHSNIHSTGSLMVRKLWKRNSFCFMKHYTLMSQITRYISWPASWELWEPQMLTASTRSGSQIYSSIYISVVVIMLPDQFFKQSHVFCGRHSPSLLLLYIYSGRKLLSCREQDVVGALWVLNLHVLPRLLLGGTILNLEAEEQTGKLCPITPIALYISTLNSKCSLENLLNR